ncbi:MAG: ThiF family adenylyltransferase [Planctomycetaceae bacterium]|nr:ThiF family adenylyltransferase [Planctomycetaceae bacterium]
MAVKPPNRRQHKSAAGRRVPYEHVTIVGAGAAGRQLALQLVAFGIPKLTVIDPALVQEGHIRSAGYLADDVGMPKVDAVGGLCHRTNPQLDFTGVQDRLRPEHPLRDAVFCCVGSIRDRRSIWGCTKSQCRLWIDVRLVGDKIQVLTARDEPSRRAYVATLAAQPRREWSTSPPIYQAAMAASLAVAQFARCQYRTPAAPLLFDLARHLVGTDGE